MQLATKRFPNFNWKSFVFPAAIILGAVLIWTDTAPYRAALSDLQNTMTTSRLEASRKAVEADIDRYTACTAKRQENPDTKSLDYTAEGRTCLLDAMPKNRTAMGALAFGITASMWLRVHPTDEEFRTAALTAIASGRSELANEKPWGFDSLEKVAEAHDRSIILRWKDGRQGVSDVFANLADQLDKAEFGVRLPDVAWNQGQWRRKVVTERK